MKLQHIIIIFVIIIVPIYLVLSAYTTSHIKTIDYQTSYSTSLINSTYDSIKAFQLNTANNMYSTISNSKIRDIEAAIKVFYSSLGNSLGSGGYTEDELKMYVPAILFNLYDGYYIYSNYYDTEKGEYTYGLKPFIYYSCRYIKDSNYDFVVNYTLDNTITVIGKVNGEYVTKTGQLTKYQKRYDVDYNLRDPEILAENLLILDGINNDNVMTEKYQYTFYNGQKIYKDNNINENTPDNNKFFIYDSGYRKTYINDSEIITYMKGSIINNDLYSHDAYDYYADAFIFTEWVYDNLRNIKASNAVDINGNQITDFASNIEDKFIFNTKEDDNDPLLTSSTFNEHRMNVIRKSIETNLIKAIATFSAHTVIGYEFAMPKLGENDWYKIENNICVTTFLQGIPVGNKMYNNYCVVSNDTNKEMVGNESIYIVDNHGEYHKPGCLKLINNLKDKITTISGAYASSDFKRKNVSLTGEDANAHTQLTGTSSGTYGYFYPQAYTACYDCIVTAAKIYSIDNIIANNIEGIDITNLNGQNIQSWYFKALGRCRYEILESNGYFK